MSGAWLQVPQPAPDARTRLYCFPYAGGSAAVFRPLAAALAPDVEVRAIALPGRGTRIGEEPRSRLEPLAAEVADALLDDLEEPFAFLGYSFGGLLAFEVARLLERAAAPLPALLVVAAAAAPHLPPREPPAHLLPDDELLGLLRRLGGIPQEVTAVPELLTALLPAIRADLAACETYEHEPGPPLPLPIVCWAGRDDELIDRAAVAAWVRHSAEPGAVHAFPGDHFFLHGAADAVHAAVAAVLREYVPVPAGW